MFLREYREKACLTQLQVALALGVVPSTINQYEKGKRNPSIEVLIKLSDLFGCTIDELVRGKEKEQT